MDSWNIFHTSWKWLLLSSRIKKCSYKTQVSSAWQATEALFFWLDFRVSSVLNRDVKQYGKKYLFDCNEETCWNSDQVKQLLVKSRYCSLHEGDCLQWIHHWKRSSQKEMHFVSKRLITSISPGWTSVGDPGVPPVGQGVRIKDPVPGRLFCRNLQTRRSKTAPFTPDVHFWSTSPFISVSPVSDLCSLSLLSCRLSKGGRL